MGLCKCPKRKVTNQFCFEHRVCVCENCMVTNHSICVVQSYLKWLQDSDYNSVCELCQQSLTKQNSIRLICYHVFHWSCLDDYSRKLPPTTAPGGRVCPTCNAALFPPSNLVGPVADALREKLAGVNWARAGLGLPLLSEEKEIVKPATLVPKEAAVVQIGEDVAANIGNGTGGAFSRLEAFHHHPGLETGVISTNRKIFQDVRENNSNLDDVFDRDDNKYKRRPFRDLLGAWWQLTFGRTSSRSRWKGGRLTSFRSKFALIICGIILLVFILFLLSNFHDRSVDDVPIIH